MRRVGLLICSLGMTVSVSAHHSFGAFYNMSEVVELWKGR